MRLNNKENASNLICYSNAPIIVTIPYTDSSKGKESMDIVYASGVPDRQIEPWVKINGHKIIAVPTFEKTKGRNFYAGLQADTKYKVRTIINALNNISEIARNYVITQKGEDRLSITARNFGSRYALTFEAQNIGVREENHIVGFDNDPLSSDISTKIYLDILYNKDTQDEINGSESATYDYLTTLEKEYYLNNVNFDISSALSTITPNGSIVEWKAIAYAMTTNKDNGNMQVVGTLTNNYAVRGYLVNQGGTYIDCSTRTRTFPAINVGRGTNTDVINKCDLFVYGNSIDISFYRINATQENVTIMYEESDKTVIHTSTYNISLNDNLTHASIPLEETYLRDSNYIELQLSDGILLYSVITPPYAQPTYTRVNWYNSAGGISFFDFVGERKETRQTSVITYNKSLNRYYDTDEQEQQVVYDRQNNNSISLTTHLMGENGLYQLYDLQSSRNAWITINGKRYYIIVNKIQVEEVSNDTFTVTITYNYSLSETFN